MELKEFIKTVIIDIVQSVDELNDELKEKGVVVAPKDIAWGDDPKPHTYMYKSLINSITFKVSLSTLSDKGKSGGISLNVVSASAGSLNKSENSTSVEFTLPIVYSS